MDWIAAEQEALAHFRNLIRINTTNPPGNEIEAARYLKAVFDKEGIACRVFEPVPGRANIVARLQGNGAKRPLLLTSHLDVVPAEAEKWQVPPFAGEVKDGCLWGRGAIDMKNMTAMSLACLLMAKRMSAPLARDLILAAVADEEEGCQWGSQWLVENHPDQVRAEYALNEVGAFSLYIGDQVFYPIGVAERGLCWFHLIAHGEPGHGSIPHRGQAVVKLAEAIQKIDRKRFPFHIHPLVEKFFQFLKVHLRPPQSWVMRLITSPFLSDWIIRCVIRDPKKAASFHAMLHNTVSPTILSAGHKINVIPSEAHVECDGRILPGQTINAFIGELKKIIGDGFEVKIRKAFEPLETEYDNEFYRLLVKNLMRHEPGAVVLPYLIPGFTDASFYSRLKIKCYGFAPVKLDRDMNFSELFHGHNERIPVDGFFFGLKVLWDVVRES